MSAPSPRPNAFLATGDYLLGKLDVGLGAFTMNVVEYDGFPMTRRLSKANISWDHCLEYLRAEEAPEVGRHLAGQSCAFVVHGEGDSLDREIWIQRPADPHQRVQQLG